MQDISLSLPPGKGRSWRAAAVLVAVLLPSVATAQRGPRYAGSPPQLVVTGDTQAFASHVIAASATGPTGNITIGDGATVTCSKTLNITYSGPPNGTVCVQMKSFSGGWGGFGWFWVGGGCAVGVAICPVQLGADGTATLTFRPCFGQSVINVTAVFTSADGSSTGSPVTASAAVDCLNPIMAGMKLKTAPSAPPTATTVSLMWTGAAKDFGSDIAGYNLTYRAAPPGGAPPAFCVPAKPGKGSVVTVLGPFPPNGTGTDANPVVVSGLVAGTGYKFRLCAFDTAGNMAGGITASAKTTP